MGKKPIVNAMAAAVYIFCVVGVMNLMTAKFRNTPDTFFTPIPVLFVLTLSAAVMAFLFFYEPLLLVIDGKKKEAAGLFVKTVGVFSIVTVVILLMFLLGVI